MPVSPIIPARLRELAAKAGALAAEIETVRSELTTAPDEPTRSSGFRLDNAAGEARRISTDLQETAEDLARVRGRSGCLADWGVCPTHGNTLTSSGGRSWCREPGCGRQWNYHRGGLPCDEPLAYTVTDADGRSATMCAGHALDARKRLDGTATTPISTLS
jgi:hypothetical protein